MQTPQGFCAVVGVTELGRNTRNYIEKAQSNEAPILVTRYGKPVAVMLPITPAIMQEYVAANFADFLDFLAQR